MAEPEQPLTGLALAAEKARQRAREAQARGEATFTSESEIPKVEGQEKQSIYFKASHNTIVLLDQHGKKHQFTNGFLAVTDPEFAEYIRENYINKMNPKVAILEVEPNEYEESKELKGSDVIIEPLPEDPFKPVPRPEQAP